MTPTPGPIRSLIEQAEKAETRDDMLTVFHKAGVLTGDVAKACDFRRHLSQAARSGSDKRALGYLLLAAMELVPEGWLITSLRQAYSPQPKLIWLATLGKTGTNEIRHATRTPAALALLICCLKAIETKDG